MKTIFFFLLASVALIACQGTSGETTNSDTQNKEASDVTLTEEDNTLDEVETFLAPAFEINLEFTDALRKKLEGTQEAIIIDVILTGIPKNKTGEEYAENGHITIGSTEKEISKEGIIKLDKVEIIKEDYEGLEKPTYEVTVNFYSARNEFENNIVSASPSIVSGKMDEIKGKTHKVVLDVL